MKKASAKTNILLIITALIWGMAFVAQSVGMDYVGPMTFVGARSILGGISLLPVIWVMGRKKTAEEKKKEDKKTLFIGGICCGLVMFVASYLQQVGVMHTTVGKAGFITALYIIIVPMLGLFLKKKVAATVWLSVAIALVGMYLLCITESFSISKGDLLVLICSVFFSVHILVIDYFSPKADGVKLSCIQFITCGILGNLFMFPMEAPRLEQIMAAWAPILYAGVMSCGIAYTLQVVAQKDADPTIASLLLSLESVFALLAGWVVLGQAVNLKEALGCVLVFAAIILAQLPVKKPMTIKESRAVTNNPVLPEK